MSRHTWICVATLLLALSACVPRSTNPVPALAAVTPERILANMPVNTNQRCTGIATVAEALLEAESEPTRQSIAVEDLAREIYASLKTGKRVASYSQVTIGGRQFATDSPAALEDLSTRVTEMYKRDFERLKQDERGRQTLVAAQSTFVTSTRDLHRLLQQDGDRTCAFCGVGTREFPDETAADTFHVFLLRELNDGSIVVFDPNDPGLPINCQIEESKGELTIGWQCRYRETGQVTMQAYSLVDGGTFFRTIGEADQK